MVAMFGICTILLVDDPFDISDQAYHDASLYPYHLSLFFFFLACSRVLLRPIGPLILLPSGIADYDTWTGLVFV